MRLRATRVSATGGNYRGGDPILAAGILDQLTTPAAAAYSLRKVRAGYSAAAVRVRRSADNAETDVGFNPDGTLNTAALLSFVGAGSGFVTTWHDQSGNGRHMTQATAASQPRIVNAGVLETRGGKPFVYTQTGMSMTTGAAPWMVAGSGDRALIAVMHKATTALHAVWSGAHTTNNAWGILNTSHLPYTYGGGDNNTGTVNLPVGSTGVMAAVRVDGTSTGYINGVFRSSNSVAINTLNTVGLGIGTLPDGQVSTGWVGEIIYFAGTLSTADRQVVEASQAAYFGIV